MPSKNLRILPTGNLVAWREMSASLFAFWIKNEISSSGTCACTQQYSSNWVEFRLILAVIFQHGRTVFYSFRTTKWKKLEVIGCQQIRQHRLCGVEMCTERGLKGETRNLRILTLSWDCYDVLFCARVRKYYMGDYYTWGTTIHGGLLHGGLLYMGDYYTWGTTAWGTTTWGTTAWGTTAWGTTAWGTTAWGTTAWGLLHGGLLHGGLLHGGLLHGGLRTTWDTTWGYYMGDYYMGDYYMGGYYMGDYPFRLPHNRELKETRR